MPRLARPARRACVDRAVAPQTAEEMEQLFYARFFDDIILVGTDEHEVTSRIQQYVDVLRGLRLPCHELVTVHLYGTEFWTLKSKAPYRWCYSPGEKGTSPWVGFLGYQIRCDGQMRVRKESIKKHHFKLIRIVDRVLDALFLRHADGSRTPRAGIRVLAEEVMELVRRKLVSAGVGA